MSNDPTSTTPAPTGDPYAVFRPVRGRIMSLAAAGGSVVLFGLIALLVTPADEGGLFGPADRAMIAVVGLGLAAFLWRYSAIRAVPTQEGLTVRNLMITTRVAWADIIDIRYHGGDAWPRLDIRGGDDLAVMAIQKSDGPRANTEAARLAALIAAHRG